MKIDKSSWHCKVYCWWYSHKYYQDQPSRSNLCPYMRAVMFWAPMRAVFGTWVKVWKIPVNAITLPILIISIPEVLGYFSYDAKRGIWQIMGMLAALGVASAIFIGIILLFSKEGLGWSVPIKRIAKKGADSSFLELIKQYFRSGHDRICPEVEWKPVSKTGDPVDDVLDYLKSL